jgi:hypothetical protein
MSRFPFHADLICVSRFVFDLIRSLDLEAEVKVKSRGQLPFSRRFPVNTRPGERSHEDQL